MMIGATDTSDLESFFANLDSCRDKNYLTHGLHPYPAKFIPHIPRELIATYALPEYPVLDPMCGSGTTLVEASLQGHRAIGIDLNPIAVLVARAKTLAPSDATRTAITALVSTFREHAAVAERVCVATPPAFHNRHKWFAEPVLRELAHALEAIGQIEPSARVFGHAAVSAVTVAVSNQESETRWCAKPRTAIGGDTLRRVAEKLEGALIRASEYAALAAAPVAVWRGDVRHLALADASVGTIITSPPYANSHDYYLYNKLRMFVLGYEVASVQAAEIGSRNRHSDMKAPIEDYLDSMAAALREWRRVLVSGGRAAVVVGDAVVRGEFFDMGAKFASLAQQAGLDVERRFCFAHRRFNSSFQRGFGTRFDKSTHVLIFS